MAIKKEDLRNIETVEGTVEKVKRKTVEVKILTCREPAGKNLIKTCYSTGEITKIKGIGPKKYPYGTKILIDHAEVKIMTMYLGTMLRAYDIESRKIIADNCPGLGYKSK